MTSPYTERIALILSIVMRLVGEERRDVGVGLKGVDGRDVGVGLEGVDWRDVRLA